MTSNDKQPNKGVAAVDRAFAIVEAVRQQSEPISLADLSRATGFYKSTLLRIIVSLDKAALVVRDQDGRYMLGPYAYELGHAFHGTYQLEGVIHPLLQTLIDDGSESGSFHVHYSATERMCLLRLDSRHPTVDSIKQGDILPLDRGAAGKLISYFYRADPIATQDTVFRVSIGERDPSCAAVACAVFGYGNKFLGAISLSGPKERFTSDAITIMAGMVRNAAEAATQELGGQWPNI